MPRKMKDLGVEWLGQVPEGWHVLRNKNCFACGKDIVGPQSAETQLLSLTTKGVRQKGRDDIGSRRAGYGDAVLLDLSNKLTDRFGAGWSVETLTKCRYFFVTYSATKIVHTVDDFCLSWSQYKTVLPSVTAFKRIIRQEQIAYEKEKLLALAAKKEGR